MEFILASNSPRRKELMSIIVKEFTQVNINTTENKYIGLTPKEKALKLSKDKCKDAISLINKENCVIITCDTIVDFNGKTLEKPQDEKQAHNMINILSGNSHKVHTGVSVYYNKKIYSLVSTTKVYFDKIPPQVIKNYVKTKEPYDKAGGYGIQGFIGGYVKKINGSYFNVVGLPINDLRKLLEFIKVL